MRRADMLMTWSVAFGLTAALGLGCSFNPGPPGSASGSGGVAGYSNTGGAIAGAGGGGGGLSADGPNCGLQSFGLQNIPPDVLIVLDKSGSMDSDFDDNECTDPGCVSKWTAMVSALGQVVADTQASIRWGLKLYANNSQCTVNPGAAVAVGENTAAQITNVISNTTPGGYTPTRAAVNGGATYLRGLTDPNPKYILLATDGLPNCYPGQSSGTEDEQGAIDAVTDAFDDGIPTFVVGVGNVSTAQATLTSMAIEGGRAQTAAPRYYPADDAAQLVSVLSNIGGQVASCTFSLGGVPPDPTNIAVNADGQRVPKDTSHANGWDYGAGQTSVELFGTWCEQVRSGQISDVQAIFGCPGQIIP